MTAVCTFAKYNDFFEDGIKNRLITIPLFVHKRTIAAALGNTVIESVRQGQWQYLPYSLPQLYIAPSICTYCWTLMHSYLPPVELLSPSF